MCLNSHCINCQREPGAHDGTKWEVTETSGRTTSSPGLGFEEQESQDSQNCWFLVLFFMEGVIPLSAGGLCLLMSEWLWACSLKWWGTQIGMLMQMQVGRRGWGPQGIWFCMCSGEMPLKMHVERLRRQRIREESGLKIQIGVTYIVSPTLIPLYSKEGDKCKTASRQNTNAQLTTR